MRTREPWDRKRRAEPSSERGSGVKGFCRLPGPFAEWRNGHRRGGVGVLSPVAPLILFFLLQGPTLGSTVCSER